MQLQPGLTGSTGTLAGFSNVDVAGPLALP